MPTEFPSVKRLRNAFDSGHIHTKENVTWRDN